LDNGETVQLHTVCDPYSGAHIGAYIYPSKYGTGRVPLKDVQTTLRRCFTEWSTLPDDIQTDREPVLVGTPWDIPTPFTLWLTGLGIRHRIIHAGRPTENGSVEREHRTLNDYGIVGQRHLLPQQLQAYLDQCRSDLNTRYPSRAKGCAGKPPLEAHPELLHPRRAYRPELELLLFDPGKADSFLASLQFERKVGAKGQITIGGEHERYQVGRTFARQYVRVSFDPATREYVAYFTAEDSTLQEVKRWPARDLEIHDLLWPGDPPPCHCLQQLALPLEFESP
jgi:hypothetical protein